MNLRENQDVDNEVDLNRVHVGLDKYDIKTTQPVPKTDSSPSMHVSESSSDNLTNSEKSTKLAQIEQSPKYVSDEKERVRPYSYHQEAQ